MQFIKMIPIKIRYDLVKNGLAHIHSPSQRGGKTRNSCNIARMTSSACIQLKVFYRRKVTLSAASSSCHCQSSASFIYFIPVNSIALNMWTNHVNWSKHVHHRRSIPNGMPSTHLVRLCRVLNTYKQPQNEIYIAVVVIRRLTLRYTYNSRALWKCEKCLSYCLALLLIVAVTHQTALDTFFTLDSIVC